MKYLVGEEVIVHTQDGRGRDVAEHPGKIIATARIMVTIEYVEGGRTYTHKFRADSKHTGDFRGPSYGPWFETPSEKETRVAVAQATEILKQHGFEIARYDTPSDAKILGVAKFLTEHYRLEN